MTLPAHPRHRLSDHLLRFAERALPQTCALCAVPSSASLVCAECAALLQRITSSCPVCALPATVADDAHGLAFRVAPERCGACLARPPAYDRTVSAFIYAFPLDRLVQSYKYQGMLACASWFAGAMIERRTLPPVADAMVAVPLAKTRQRERGFNQALEIARVLSRQTGIPLLPHAATRTRDTPPQASLPWRERARNVRGAFACTDSVAGKRVLVVDDVMTTGASLDEFAATLKRAGALEVENWLVARTLPPAERS